MCKLLKTEMPLFRKFPEFREFQMHFRKLVTSLCGVARPNKAENFEIQEILNGPCGISVLHKTTPKLDADNPGRSELQEQGIAGNT